MPNVCGLAVTGPAGFNDDDVISLNRSLACVHVPPLAEETVQLATSLRLQIVMKCRWVGTAEFV